MLTGTKFLLDIIRLKGGNNMKPKEIQKELGITADRIKLFKREGIFFPENPPLGNRSTNYTDTDFDNLQLIVVLTKSGLTCGDIKKIQDGELTLTEAIIVRRQSINAEIERKRNSLELLSQILDARAEYHTFETKRFWGFIQEREEDGDEFISFEDLYGYETVSLIRIIGCPYCHENQEIDLEDYVYDQSGDEKENGMGPEIVYSFDTEEDLACFCCGRHFRVSGWIREYPIGAYDSEDVFVEALCGEENEEHD